MAASAAPIIDSLQIQTPTPTPARPPAMRLSMSGPPRLDAPSTGLMSPVNQNGCFEFDRILKAGTLVKRTRKTKQWKAVYVVLRPNCLSVYKDKEETKLRHQINLADITAVARQKDSKKKMDHVFGIFSPARNYHLGATADSEAQEWVDLIRVEARMSAGEDEGEAAETRSLISSDRSRRDRLASSSSEAEARPSSAATPEHMHSARRPSQALYYSGNERGSISDFDFSDTGFHASNNSLSRKKSQQKHNVSQQSSIGAMSGHDRVVNHGWLYVLKSKGGVRQWKKIWVVLRPKCLAFYKDSQEYAAMHIIQLSSIIDAVDIDPISRSKQFCMQVICEEKNFKFCAADENSLAKWLGAFKSLLARKSAAVQNRILQPTSGSGNIQSTAKPIASSTALAPTQEQPTVKPSN